MARILRSSMLFGAIGTICLLIVTAQAGYSLDTSGPLICAFTSGYDCDVAEGCQATTPEAIGLPSFIKLDRANSKVVAAGAGTDRRETAVRGFHEADGKLFLQGIERRGWSAVIDRETGQMTLAASEHDAAIVFFGRCTAP